jgi:hypothetical protein
MVNKAKEIANGYKNLLKSTLGLSSEEDEKIFDKRREICNACEFRNAYRDTCTSCGCPLVAKTKSLITNCPEKLW